MTTPPYAATFPEALGQIEEAYRDGIRAFAQWVAAKWGMTREDWQRSTAEEAPSEEWFAGNRAALDGLPDAAAFFLEEFDGR